MISLLKNLLTKEEAKGEAEQIAFRLQKMRQTQERAIPASSGAAEKGTLAGSIASGRQEAVDAWKQSKISDEERQRGVADMAKFEVCRQYIPGDKANEWSEANNFSYWLRGH